LQVTFPTGESFAVEELGRALRERSKTNDEQGGEETGEGRHKLGRKNKNATGAVKPRSGKFSMHP
jgi:hypothetical protein